MILSRPIRLVRAAVCLGLALSSCSNTSSPAPQSPFPGQTSRTSVAVPDVVHMTFAQATFKLEALSLGAERISGSRNLQSRVVRQAPAAGSIVHIHSVVRLRTQESTTSRKT